MAKSSEGIANPPHTLFCSKIPKWNILCVIIRKCHAKVKIFFKLTPLRNADVQFTDTQTEGKALIRQKFITKQTMKIHMPEARGEEKYAGIPCKVLKA